MKIFIPILFIFFFVNCKAQKIKDLSSNQEMNYIFARIYTKSITKELYDGILFVTIYEISDSNATPEDFSEGEEFLYSYLISVIPDGDYYSYSKLYKVEGLINPKILEIKETIFPMFSIKIEHGDYKNRKIEVFEFEGPK